MSTVLVTGAAGYLGSAVVKALLEDARHRVVALTRSQIPRLGGPAEWLPCDLAEFDQVARAFAGRAIDAVVHAAAVLPGGQADYPAIALRDNVVATANVLRAAGSVRRFLFCSTISVYEDVVPLPDGLAETQPLRARTPYAVTKLAGEELTSLRNAATTCGISLRFAGLHGAPRRSGAVFRMLSAAMAGQPISVDEPDSRFRFLFVSDAARAVRAVLDHAGPAQDCYNVAGRETTTLAELAAAIDALAGTKASRNIRSSVTVRQQVMDTRRIEDEIGFQARPLREHLEMLARELGAGAPMA